MALTSFLMCVILATALVHASDEAGSNRIIGGEEAEANSWPWQVSLQRVTGSHYCGGVLLNKYWVLTAAHCKQPASGTPNAVLGAHDRTDGDQTIPIVYHLCHPNYNSRLIDWDYCLLKLATPATLNDKVQPVRLADPSTKEEANGPAMDCYITGWGYSKHDAQGNPNTIAKYLQEAPTNLITLEECKRKWRLQTLTSRQQCVNMDGSTACMGDSGGPLVCRPAGSDDEWRLLGVTSWGHSKCNVNGYPHAYARVSDPTANAWIKSNAGLHY